MQLRNELVADNLQVWRGEQHVLQGVAFRLGAACCLQVTGVNGAGKTTLLRALCGLVPLEEGRIQWCSHDIRTESESFHAELCYLGHDNGLKADLTATENLHYAAQLRRRVRAQDIATALERVGVPEVGSLLVRRLSAGQRRRVALARMTLMGGSLWIMDEPASNLDVHGQELVLQLLLDHVSTGGMAVVATHQALNLPPANLQLLVLQ